MSNTGPNGEKDPWSKRNQDGPPDLFELIKKYFKKPSGQSAGDGNDNVGMVRYVWWGVGVVFIIWLLAGIYVVRPAQQAVVLRFGKYTATTGPGPHWIPRMIDSKTVINVQQVNNFPYQSEMLTSDENIVSVALAVQYRIANPEAYLFNVVDPITTLHQATSSALRQVVGQMTLDAILTTGRQKLRDEVAKQLNETMLSYKTGLEVTDVTLQPVQPPEAVTEAFNDAIKAREDKQRFINQARAYARKVESIAKGQIARLTQSALAYKQEVVLRSQGAVARYLALLKPYEHAPGVTRERLYLDSVSHVLSRTTNIIVDSGSNNILYLPLDKIIKQQLTSTDKQADMSGTPSVKTSLPSATMGAPYQRPVYPQKGENS